MAIYNTGGFSPTKPSLINTFDLTDVETIDLQELGDSILEIENDNIENIQKNYEAVLDAKDSLTQLDFKTAYNKDLLERKRQQYNINDDMFNLDAESLKDPFVKRNIESTLNNFLSDPEIEEAIRESKKFEELETEVQRMKRKNPKMAKVMMSQLNEIKLDPTGSISPMELSAEDFQEVNLDQVAQQYFLNNPNLELKYKGNDPRNGYIVYDKVRNINMTEEEFVEELVGSLGNDPRVVNTILANSFDPNKPPSEQYLRDPQAVSSYLSKVGKRAFDGLQGSVVDSVLKEDKIGVARAKAALSKQSGGGGSASNSLIFGTDSAANRARIVENDLIMKGYDVADLGGSKLMKLGEAESWDIVNQDGQEVIMGTTKEGDPFYMNIKPLKDDTQKQATEVPEGVNSVYSGMFKGNTKTKQDLTEKDVQSVAPRTGVRNNADNSVSTYKMAWGESDGKYVAYPTLFQDEQGNWYEPKDPFKEAVKKGEVFEFNSEQEAEKFALGSWKGVNKTPAKTQSKDLKASSGRNPGSRREAKREKKRQEKIGRIQREINVQKRMVNLNIDGAKGKLEDLQRELLELMQQ